MCDEEREYFKQNSNRKLDKMEARYGVRFDRAAMFKTEDELENQCGDAQWSFHFSPSGQCTATHTEPKRPFRGARDMITRNPDGSIMCVVSPKGYPSGNGLETALRELKNQLETLNPAPQWRKTVRTLTEDQKQEIRANVVRFNETLRINIDPAELIKTYENIPEGPTTLIVEVPSDPAKPATFEVIGSEGKPDVMVFGQKIALSTLDRTPTTNTAYICQYANHDTAQDWLAKNRLPSSETPAALQELINVCSADGSMTVRITTANGQHDYGWLNKGAVPAIKELFRTYQGQVLLLDIGLVSPRPRITRITLDFRPPSVPCQKEVNVATYRFYVGRKSPAEILRDLAATVKESGQGN